MASVCVRDGDGKMERESARMRALMTTGSRYTIDGGDLEFDVLEQMTRRLTTSGDLESIRRQWQWKYGQTVCLLLSKK
jgi:hypothetical protein